MNVLTRTFEPGALEATLDELERGEWAGLVLTTNAGRALSPPGRPERPSYVYVYADALMRVRYCPKPVVVAASGATTGIALELAMSAARVVASADATFAFGREIPSNGGCKEMVRRFLSPVMKSTPNADPVPFLQNLLAGKPLAIADRIVAADVVEAAQHEVVDLASAGYTPPPREPNCYAAGRDARAALRSSIHQLKQGAFLSDADAERSRKLAHILCGGEISAPAWVHEEYFLELEKTC